MGYSYYTFTGTQGVGYYQSPATLADFANINFSTRNYGAEGEFVFHLRNIKKALTTTMTSYTAEAHAELII